MEVKIIGLDHQGRGIAKDNNKIVFVSNALPNEIVDIKYTVIKKNFSIAEVIKIIKKSNKRVENLCPYYGECGGCDLLHLAYDEQLKFKEDKIRNIFSKYLNENIMVKEIVKSPKCLHYRNKVTLHNNKKIGLYKNNSNDIIKIDKCLLLDDDINKVIKQLCDINEKEIIIRKGNNDIMMIPNIKMAIDGLNIKEKTIYQKIGNKTFSIVNNAFFQINTSLVEQLYDKVLDYIKSNKNQNVLDLYCGTGTISIFISEYANKVLGIEINKEAIESANANKKLNNCHNVEFICADISKLKEIKFNPNIVIIDPPRAGLTKNIIDNIIDIKPKQIIYISCDPMTLVRDLNLLKDKYNIIEVTPFDMFPNTHHVETIALLSKNDF